SHEAFSKCLRLLRHTLCEDLALLDSITEICVPHFIKRLWRVLNFGRLATPRPQHSAVIWECQHVERGWSGTFTPEPFHTARHIGSEPDPRLLAVITNVNADFELFCDNPLDSFGDLTLKLCFVDDLPTLLAN